MLFLKSHLTAHGRNRYMGNVGRCSLLLCPDMPQQRQTIFAKEFCKGLFVSCKSCFLKAMKAHPFDPFEILSENVCKKSFFKNRFCIFFNRWR